MSRGGVRKDRSQGPERRCIVTRASAPAADLIRFVVGPGDEVVPDISERLPGRGMWVSSDPDVLADAASRGAFARAARHQVRVPEDLPAKVEGLLARHLIETLALARKAGRAVAGLEKTRTALESGSAALLVQAADGSPRERAALRPPDGPETLLDCLFADEMGMAFGRDRVIHAGLLSGGLAEKAAREGRRLAGLRRGTARRPIETRAAGDVAGEGSRMKG